MSSRDSSFERVASKLKSRIFSSSWHFALGENAAKDVMLKARPLEVSRELCSFGFSLEDSGILQSTDRSYEALKVYLWRWQKYEFRLQLDHQVYPGNNHILAPPQNPPEDFLMRKIYLNARLSKTGMHKSQSTITEVNSLTMVLVRPLSSLAPSDTFTFM